LTALLLSTSLARADDLHALMRTPAIHGDSVVFVSHGNLWQVSRSGGKADRLTADPGQDLMPRFSPDGHWIAFTASYQSNQDVYVIPSGGGEARRLTFHSDIAAHTPTRWGPDNLVLTWTPDSKNVVFLTRAVAWNPSVQRAFEVPVTGGLPTPLPLDSSGFLTYGPDGHSIAYNRWMRDFRTWKRYDGGLAQSVFTYDFDSKKLTRITTWKGTNTSPMWFGRKIYYLCDNDQVRRRNIWVHDLDTNQDHQVTHFTDYDIEFPSLGDKAIVFQKGGQLFVTDLPSERTAAIDVTVPDDGTRTQPRTVKVAPMIRDEDTAHQTDFALSPNGERAAFSARGDIFTVPAEHGPIRNLTASSGADDDHPAWSPDGRTIAYTTDASGAQQIAVRPATYGPARALTHAATGFFYTPVWSPDGKRLAYSDNAHVLWVVGLDGGEPVRIAADPYREIHDQVWSPDSRYLAYSLERADNQRSIWLHDMQSGKSTDLSNGLENDQSPVFTTDGKYLAFVSARHENPTFSESERDFATLKTAGIYLAPLASDTPTPFAPQSDEGALPPPKPDHPAPSKSPASAPVRIDIDGLLARAVPLPIEDASIASLDARAGKLFYMTQSPETIEGHLPGEQSALHVYDIAARKDGTVIEGIDDYALSADGTKVLTKRGADYMIADAKPQHGTEGQHKLDLSTMQSRIEPRQEWGEMFENAWRLERDFFFSTAMNGVNWQSVHDNYVKLLPLVGSRDDLDDLIGQIQGELGNSHTYAGAGGDMQNPTPPAPTMLLGVDFKLDAASGRYEFAKIYPGDNSRPDYRSPLAAPGLNVHEGDVLLAVNGQDLKAPTDPYSLFVGVASPVTLTIAGTPTGKPRDILVAPVRSELDVRELDWIDTNRRTVDRLSGGRIGYVYLSDMSRKGLEQFVRQFYPQADKQAMIIDDRWNGGGFIDPLVLDRLRRVLVGMDVNRERIGTTVPETVLNGPKVVLINHWSASDGDIFPANFKAYGLGKLIGERTWGGVRGIRGEWTLLDGGEMTVPEYARYGLDSQWQIENHGVDPDIAVDDQPADLLAGHDKQLETGVSTLLAELAARPSVLPPPPPLLPPYPPVH
jgi:tricorn protease